MAKISDSDRKKLARKSMGFKDRIKGRRKSTNIEDRRRDTFGMVNRKMKGNKLPRTPSKPRARPRGK